MNSISYSFAKSHYLFSLLALLATPALAGVHGDDSDKSFKDRCKSEIGRWKKDCKELEPDSTDPGRYTLSSCLQSVKYVRVTIKSVSKEDSPSIGARNECRIHEVRSDGTINLTIINSLGGKTVSYWNEKGGFNVTYYAKGGGMLDCQKENGEEKFSWCGINDAIMMEPSKSYDFLKKAPTKEQLNALVKGAPIAKIFPLSARTLEDPAWHIHAKKPAPVTSDSSDVDSLVEEMKGGVTGGQ